MSFSINGDVLGLYILFAIFCQLAYEVIVFGWDRDERYTNFSNWMNFVATSRVHRIFNYTVDAGVIGLWVFAFYKFPVEAGIAFIVAVCVLFISLYFTLVDSKGEFRDKVR